MSSTAGQQWTGVNFYFSYGSLFFRNAGIADAFLIQVILGAVNVGSTFPGLLAVEKLGRRQTLFIGSAIMFTGQVVTGALATAYPQDETVGKVLITFSCLFIFGFASSWGPLGWVVAAEQFPVRAASYCVAFATASNWVSLKESTHVHVKLIRARFALQLNNFVIAMITPPIQDEGYGNLGPKIVGSSSRNATQPLAESYGLTILSYTTDIHLGCCDRTLDYVHLLLCS